MKNNSSIIYNVSLVIGDALALTAAFTIAYILRVSVSHTAVSTPVSSSSYIKAFFALLPFWILIFALLGLYNSRIYNNRFQEIARLFVGTFIGILFVISFSYIADIKIFPARLVTGYAFIFALLLETLFRTIARGIRRYLFDYGIGINKVLIVGDTQASCRLINSLKNTATTGYKVVGIVGGDKHKVSGERDYHKYESFEEAVSHLKGHLPDTIIQTELYSSSEKNDEILNFAQQHHIAYGFVPGNSELFFGKIEASLFFSTPLIAVHQTPLIGWGRVVKRFTDILLGGILLLLMLPFILLFALLTIISDGFPIMFKQERLSRFNKKVYVYKIRTHKKAFNNLEPEEAFEKLGKPEYIKQYRENGDYLENDPRVTRIGRFIRRFSLDELPQLYNVFIGDISLVGPRALVPYELEKYDQKNLITSVRSGLTGLAQISGVRDLNFYERRKLDLYYVENWSFWSDIVIMIKTFWVVLTQKGTRI